MHVPLDYNIHFNNVLVCIYFKLFSLFSSSIHILARSTGEILKVSVNAPCNNEYCTFYKGADARLEFSFKLRKRIKHITNKKKHSYIFLIGKKAHKIRAKVVATIGTVDHDFALPNHDVCQQLGCPIQADVPYSYHNSMFVSQTYPSVCDRH
ncbi:MAG: hypothetical protein IT281_11170 [Ignavibacteria bacterium]|nr:hypothetical protein [Ignavibacteria bacterium]